MESTSSESTQQDEVVVPEQIEPSRKHPRLPIISTIQMHTTSEISNGNALKSCFPSCSMRASLEGGTAQNTTKPLLSRSRATLLVKGSDVTPVITHISNEYERTYQQLPYVVHWRIVSHVSYDPFPLHYT